MISNIKDRIRLLFVAEKKPFLELKAILGFYPHDIKLYQLALKHKSVAYYERERLRGISNKELKKEMKKQNAEMFMNNERLEFLGDAVLGAIVADILYKHYKSKQEGFLTSLRSKIVCRSSLNKLAVALGLDKLILHSGAVTTGHNSYMNGNAFEAFFGAIYLDRGYAFCYKFLEEKVFGVHIDIDKVAKLEGNFKSSLIEWCQKYKYKFQYNQRETRDKKDQTTPMFESVVLIEGIECGRGLGYSKKESDQKASEQALRSVRSDDGTVEKIKDAIQRRKNEQLALESKPEELQE